MYQQQQQTMISSKKDQHFHEKFPLSLVATLGALQMLITFAIFALEIAHNILHMKLTNLFVGFWVTIPFTILWISMFAVVCCCRQQSCATHAVIQNILGFVFACVLIGINLIFIRQPNTCFFSEGICQSLSWTSYISDPIECLVDGLAVGCGHTRISLIMAQLVCGVLMALTCLVYLFIYTRISLEASKANRCQSIAAAETLMTPIYPTNGKPLPMNIGHHHHQTCSIAPQPYQTAVPVMMAVYPPQPPMLALDGTYMSYNSPNQYSTMHPQINPERF